MIYRKNVSPFKVQLQHGIGISYKINIPLYVSLMNNPIDAWFETKHPH